MAEKDMTDADQLRALTQDLLVKANAGDWDAVIAIEAKRRPLLSRVFATMAAPDTSTQYQTLINEILSADREITHLAQQRRDELAGLLRQVELGRSARQAYEGNSR